MPITRRQFASLAGTGALGLAAQGERPSRDEVLAALDRRGERGFFGDPDWLELLREAVERQRALTAELEAYALPPGAEPVITFARY